jgi:hypothetical protein
MGKRICRVERAMDGHERRGLTITLDHETVCEARAVADDQSMSLQRILSDMIEKTVARDIQYRTAREGALRHLKMGISLGGPPYPSREELHERKP